jgi:hypothetical protein
MQERDARRVTLRPAIRSATQRRSSPPGRPDSRVRRRAPAPSMRNRPAHTASPSSTAHDDQRAHAVPPSLWTRTVRRPSPVRGIPRPAGLDPAGQAPGQPVSCSASAVRWWRRRTRPRPALAAAPERGWEPVTTRRSWRAGAPPHPRRRIRGRCSGSTP